VEVIAQTIKQLWSVGLGIDWLHLNALGIDLFLWTFGFGFDVQASLSFPYPSKTGEGAKVF
jgi:hypothetical protein